MTRRRWRLVLGLPEPFGLASRGYTCALRGQQIHLEVTDFTLIEPFERALIFKRFLARFGTRVN